MSRAALHVAEQIYAAFVAAAEAGRPAATNVALSVMCRCSSTSVENAVRALREAGVIRVVAGPMDRVVTITATGAQTADGAARRAAVQADLIKRLDAELAATGLTQVQLSLAAGLPRYWISDLRRHGVAKPDRLAAMEAYLAQPRESRMRALQELPAKQKAKAKASTSPLAMAEPAASCDPPRTTVLRPMPGDDFLCVGGVRRRILPGTSFRLRVLADGSGEPMIDVALDALDCGVLALEESV